MTEETIRIDRHMVLHGANWLADGSIVGAVVVGHRRSIAWSAMHAVLERLLPAGPHDVLLAGSAAARGPDDGRAPRVIEAVARLLLLWCEQCPTPRRRSPLADARPDIAFIARDWEPLSQAALALAAEATAFAAGAPMPPERIADIRGRLAELRRVADGWLKGSRRRIVAAAAARRIPWRQLESLPAVVQLGEGRSARRFDSSGTGATSVVAATLSGNKRVANATLRRAGLPVARQIRVDSAADAQRAADALGLPLVLKPEASREMQGMHIVFRAGDIADAWASSAATGMIVVAESYIRGNEYRILVMDGRVIAAAMRRPVLVTGDGRASIAALVARENADPRRGDMEMGYPLAPITVDAAALHHLAASGLTLDDVPAPGERVQVHPLPMMRFGGGEKVDVTDLVHPDNRDAAVRALTVLGLDLGGIDFRTPDIGRSWREVGGGICEVNPQPNIGLHYETDAPRDVARMLVDRACPPGTRMHMASVLLIGRDDLGPAAAAVAGVLAERLGWRVGIAVGPAVDLAGFRPDTPVRALRDAYGLLAEDVTLDAAVYGVTAEHAVRHGLAMERAAVALIGDGAQTVMEPLRQSLATAGAAVERLPDRPEDAAAIVMKLLAFGRGG